MELRSYSHLHFVHAIQGDSVIKLLNVTRGRPVLTFKKIGEIYEAGEAKHDDSVPWMKDELLFDPNKVKLESTTLPMAERNTTIRELDTSDLNCSTSDEERNSDLDDLGFCNTTLKQIKESCKAKKRKLETCVNSNQRSFECCFPLKRDYSKLEPEEDEDDLKRPLSIWKLKISKNRKGKRKCMRNDTLTSPQSAIVIVKSELPSRNHNFSQPSGCLPTPIDTAVEANEPNYFDCKTMTCVAADSSFDFTEQVDSCGVVIDKVRVTASECDLETDVSVSSSTEQQSCLVNEESYECMECVDPETVHDLEVSGWEIVNVNCPEIISYKYPDFSVTEFENERYIIHPLLDIIPPQPISVINDHGSCVRDIFHHYRSVDHISWPSCSDNQVQGLDMDIHNRLQRIETIDVDGLCLLEDSAKDGLPSINSVTDCASDDRLQCMEIIDVDGECLLENCSKDDLPSYQEQSTISPVRDCSFSNSSDSCLTPDKPFVSVAEDSPQAEDKQLPSSACAYEVMNCSTAIHPFEATEELTKPSHYEDHLLNVRGSSYEDQPKLLCHPERLFSTRKVISPTSRERLCKAMQTLELHNDDQSECRGKLWFGKQRESTVDKAEESYKVKGAGVTKNMKQVHWKPKHDKKGSHSKGILKGPHLSSSVPSLSTRCTSSGSLSQSAIAFSQRQMQDIESLATKLAGELGSMKDVVNELLHSQAFPATSLKHNMDKVTMAIKNATKAEETARRWLSIMARDCNRFCKIMNLTGTGAIASGNVVKKARKKITFADEAGGELCHVKVIKDEMDSEPESSDVEK